MYDDFVRVISDFSVICRVLYFKPFSFKDGRVNMQRLKWYLGVSFFSFFDSQFNKVNVIVFGIELFGADKLWNVRMCAYRHEYILSIESLESDVYVAQNFLFHLYVRYFKCNFEKDGFPRG